jgi:hypothetical protein
MDTPQTEISLNRLYTEIQLLKQSQLQIQQDIGALRQQMADLNKKMDDKFVSHDQFKLFNDSINAIYNKFDALPNDYAGKLTQNIVFGAIGLIVTIVFSALIYLVVVK